MCLCLITPVVHGHERGKYPSMCLVVEPYASCAMSFQHVFVFNYPDGARAWTRQAHWYVP